MRRNFCSWLVLGAGLWGPSGAVAGQAQFLALGDLPGGNFESRAFGVSSDGTTVVGQGTGVFGNEAFRWRLVGGMQGLGELAGGSFFSTATATSSDGNIVVGWSSSSAGNNDAFIWRSVSGVMQSLGDLPGGAYFSRAFDISNDGTRIVGSSGSVNGIEESWRMPTPPVPPAPVGPLIGIGDLPGGEFSGRALGVSADGSVIVGSSSSNASGRTNREAFMWTQALGMVGIGDLTGGNFWSEATSVSSNGQVIVGEGSSNNGNEAFRWVGGVFTALGDLAGGGFASRALDTNADGSVIVGTGTTGSGGEAFIWTQANGMQNLKTLLESMGVDMTGWRLIEATAVSDNGQTIAGWGLNPSGKNEAWVITLVPEPGTLGLLAIGGWLLARRRRPKAI
ncbi:MAG: PEP-CTERM sorting domain-containing protein [Phycisphaerae bacterium]